VIETAIICAGNTNPPNRTHDFAQIKLKTTQISAASTILKDEGFAEYPQRVSRKFKLRP